jgi:DNA-binding XRE family transcriptional regulator
MSRLKFGMVTSELAVGYKPIKKITQTKLSKLSQISQPMISAICNGKARPSWKLAKRLIQAVPGTTIELWMEGTPEHIREAISNARQPEQTECK